MASVLKLCIGLIGLGIMSTPSQAKDPQNRSNIGQHWEASWGAYFGQNRQDGEAGAPGVTTDITAQTLTLERRVSDGFSIGFDLLYETQEQVQNEPSAGMSQAGRLAQKSYEANAYARFTKGIFSIEPNVRVGFDDYDLERPTSIGATPLVGRADTQGYHVGLYLEATALVPLNNYLFMRPVVTYDYEYLTADPFKETGVVSGPFDANISFDRVHDRRSIGEAGLGLGAQIPVSDNISLTPFAIGKYRRNFITGPVSVTGHLGGQTADLPLASGQEKEGFIFDTGAFMTGKDNIEVWTVYRGQYFPSSTRHGIAGQIKISF